MRRGAVVDRLRSIPRHADVRSRDLAVGARFWQGEGAGSIAADYGVGPEAVYRWAARSLSYACPESAALRRLAGR